MTPAKRRHSAGPKKAPSGEQAVPAVRTSILARIERQSLLLTAVSILLLGALSFIIANSLSSCVHVRDAVMSSLLLSLLCICLDLSRSLFFPFLFLKYHTSILFKKRKLLFHYN